MGLALLPKRFRQLAWRSNKKIWARPCAKDPRQDLVRSCGYVSTKADGSERLNFTAFYEALLNAKGVDFGAAPKAGKAGRKLSFNTKVQFNGNLMVGKAYTAMLDLKPGDEFEIKLGRKQIRLVPLGAEEEEG
jgi:hypothetical protein